MFDWIARHPYVSALLSPFAILAFFVWETISVRIAGLVDWWFRRDYSDRDKS